jgi:DNA-directed RNA polymerase specialized sigma54-like protein
MGSKQEETAVGHKAYYEVKLNERRSYLVEKGIDPQGIAKDTILKNLKSKVKKMNLRMAALAAIKKRTEELAKIKADRLAAPKKVKEKVSAAPVEEVKEKKKKKKKKEAEAPAT